MNLTGYATPEGTARYVRRFGDRVSGRHYNQSQGLLVSSIGIGTYLGEPDQETDLLYRDAVVRSVELGSNVIDTAINYRCQRSERAIGRALDILMREKGFHRDEIFVATKAGFIPFDGDYPPNPAAYVSDVYFSRGVVRAGEVAAGCHVLSARYLEDQLGRSLGNLGLETVDLFYLHNPETQLEEKPRKQFCERMQEAFEFLERCVAQGKIRMYGTATWNGYRVSQDAPGYLSLEELVLLARGVGGAGHHFRAVQLPYNMAMPEAFISQNQQVGGGQVSILDACRRYGLAVMTSASLAQGNLVSGAAKKLRPIFEGTRTGAQCALQFVRSTPGVTTALVGMKRVEHVEENLALARMDPLGSEDFIQLFARV